MTGPGAGPPLLECEREDATRVPVAEARYEFLSAAMAVLGDNHDYETTMARVAQLAVPRFADWASVNVLTAEGMRRVAVAHRDPERAPLTAELIEHHEIDLHGTNGAAAAVRTATPQMVRDIDDRFLEAHVESPRQRDIYRALGSRSGVAAPMLVDGRVVGVLTLLLGDSGRRYHPDDVDLAVELARLCAVVVDNAERRRAADQALDAARERARRLNVVAELGRFALGSSDVREILDQAVLAVAETLSVSHAAMLELTADGSAFRTTAGCGWREEVYAALVPSGRESQAGFTVATDAPVVVDDMAAESRFEVPPLLRAHAIVSSATVVVRTPHAAVGVLGAYSDVARRFTDDDATFLLSIANIVGTAVGRSRDVSALRAARQDAEDARERLSFLAAASAALTESLDSQATVERVASLAVPRLADWCAVEVRLDAEVVRRAVSHVDPARVALASEIQARYPADPNAEHGVGMTLRTGRSQLYPEVSDDLVAASARDPAHAELLLQLGVRSAMVVPLVARGRVLGALTLAAAESGRRYADDDLHLAEDLARRAAVAIDNARLYEEHERVAHTLQASLLPPSDLEIPGFEIAAVYRPAGKGTRIGGDFFDAFETTRGWAVAIGDVCGKGVDAAAITGVARHTLRAAALRDHDPARLLAVVNEALLGQIPEDRFCTLMVARFERDGDGAVIEVGSAGHPFPIVVRATGEVETVGSQGTLLGMFPVAAVDVVRVAIGAGDSIVFFTDGVTEARASGEVFGDHRLHDVLAATAGARAVDVVGAVDTAVVVFQGGEPHDDIAIVAVRVAS